MRGRVATPVIVLMAALLGTVLVFDTTAVASATQEAKGRHREQRSTAINHTDVPLSQQLGRTNATILLTELRSLPGRDIPASAASSMVSTTQPHKAIVGMDVPKGARQGSAARYDARLLKIDVGEVSAMYVDETRRRFLTGGFNHPVDDEAPRTPWIRVVAQNGIPTYCRIVVAGEREAIPELREVLAFDAENVYLGAVADGEEIVVAARYSIEIGNRGD